MPPVYTTPARNEPVILYQGRLSYDDGDGEPVESEGVIRLAWEGTPRVEFFVRINDNVLRRFGGLIGRGHITLGERGMDEAIKACIFGEINTYDLAPFEDGVIGNPTEKAVFQAGNPYGGPLKLDHSGC